MSAPWDAARAASRRPLRKPYKVCGPVYPEGLTAIGLACNYKRGDDGGTCRKCGHVLCSCQPEHIVGMDVGYGDQSVVLHGTYANGKLTIERVEERPKPVSYCYFGAVTGQSFHTSDCGTGVHRCALAGKP